MKSIRLFLVLLVGGLCMAAGTVSGADLTINAVSQFSALDGSGSDDDGLLNGCLTVNGNLTIASGGSINANDPATPANNSASNICINVGGNVEIQGGGAIFAENRIQSGNGGLIDMNIGGNFTMLNGATISVSRTTTGGNGNAGTIHIELDGSVVMEKNSAIQANTAKSSSAGSITIIASGPSSTIDIDGTVEAAVLTGLTGTGANQKPDGGPITIVASCRVNVTDDGKISSRGKDAGADLVHLEACDVRIEGLVESTGNGHGVPNSPPNHLGPPNRPDKPAKSVAGVEVWAGNTLFIDGLNENGQINADIDGTGGTRSWIDLFSGGDLTIIGPISDPPTNFAVHANANKGTAVAGLVTVKSIGGNLTAQNNALQADGTAGGSKGGLIILEALLAVDLDTAVIFARGDSNQIGGYGAGGKVHIRSFTSGISWTSGQGNVLPTGTDNVPPILDASNRGVITLKKCTTLVLGATFPSIGAATTPETLADDCTGAPLLPCQDVQDPKCIPYVILDCTRCGEQACDSPCVFDCAVLTPSGQLQLTGENLGQVTHIAIFDAAVPVPLNSLQNGNAGCDLTPADFTTNGSVLTSNNPLFCSTGNIVIVLHYNQGSQDRSLVVVCGGAQSPR